MRARPPCAAPLVAFVASALGAAGLALGAVSPAPASGLMLAAAALFALATIAGE